jgi:hypothetical protein
MFNKSLKNVADYLQLNHGNDVSEAVCNMLPVVITIPYQPTGKTDPMDSTKTLPVTDVDLHIWKCKYSKAHDCKEKYDVNMAKAYIVIYHQCSPTLKNDLKAAPTFATVRSNQDVIALLKLVQSLCCSYDSKTQSVMAVDGNVGNMSATRRPNSQMSALLADISLSWQHKTNSDTVFLCRGLPTFTPFFLEYQRYIRRIPL